MATKIIRSLSDLRNDPVFARNVVISFLIGALIGVLSAWLR